MPQFAIVRLTAPGRGAVATVLVEGPGAAAAVEAEFRPRAGPPGPLPVDRPRLGSFGPAGEEIVACRRGNGSIELHCHGGRAAAAMIEQTLAAHGGTVVDWQQWIERQEDEPIRAAARQALALATTERAALVLLDQYHGALHRAMQEIEATAASDPAAARAQCDALLARAPLGCHLTTPWRVALAGRPNVGKSSLMNAIVGFVRAIVHAEPGTTRDVLTAETALDGWPVEFYDTAGLRATTDTVELEGVARAEQAMRQADLVVLILDRSATWSDEDEALLARWPAALVVQNKCDLPPGRGQPARGAPVSAKTGEGIERLLRTVASRLVPDAPAPGVAVPFTAEQAATIERLRDRLAAGVSALPGRPLKG